MEFSRTLRDDPTGPNIMEFLEQTLDSFHVNRAQLEDEAVRQMTLCRDAATEYVAAVAAFKEAEHARDLLFSDLAENERGTGEKLTETAIKQRVARDPRMAEMASKHRNAEVRVEAAKLAMKLYWERGENIRALLFSRNTEMRALGAPTLGSGGMSSALPQPGDLTKRVGAKYGKKG